MTVYYAFRTLKKRAANFRARQKDRTITVPLSGLYRRFGNLTQISLQKRLSDSSVAALFTAGEEFRLALKLISV